MRHMTRVLARYYTCRNGAETLIRRLRSAGIVVAVFSDYASLPERLNAIGLSAGLFDVCAEAETAGALKPAVRPFSEIAAVCKIPPEHILVVGDRSDTDGAGAAAAGMSFLQIRTRRTGQPAALPWDAFLLEADTFLASLSDARR